MKIDDYTTCKQCGEMVECDDAETLQYWKVVQGKGLICKECVEENEE